MGDRRNSALTLGSEEDANFLSAAQQKLRRRTVANITKELQTDYEIIKRLDAIVHQNFGVCKSLGPPLPDHPPGKF